MTALISGRDGLLIAVDGPSGVGKSTLCTNLSALLRAAGLDVHQTTQPSTGPIGTLARELTQTVGGHALACLYAADRYHQATTEIAPRLAAGQTVVTDRYTASGMVMQRHDDVDVTFLDTINRPVLEADLTILLTGAPNVVRARLTQRGAHNRYQDRPDATANEVSYFLEAADRLARANARIERIDTTALDAATVAERAAALVLEVPRDLKEAS
ncbi:dTMP kinase [Promicromonospora soli]